MLSSISNNNKNNYGFIFNPLIICYAIKVYPKKARSHSAASSLVSAVDACVVYSWQHATLLVKAPANHWKTADRGSDFATLNHRPHLVVQLMGSPGRRGHLSNCAFVFPNYLTILTICRWEQDKMSSQSSHLTHKMLHVVSVRNLDAWW